MAIIVFFLVWGFILISNSFGANIKDRDEAWKKYQQSRIKLNKYNEKKAKKLNEY